MAHRVASHGTPLPDVVGIFAICEIAELGGAGEKCWPDEAGPFCIKCIMGGPSGQIEEAQRFIVGRLVLVRLRCRRPSPLAPIYNLLTTSSSLFPFHSFLGARRPLSSARPPPHPFMLNRLGREELPAPDKEDNPTAQPAHPHHPGSPLWTPARWYLTSCLALARCLFLRSIVDRPKSPDLSTSLKPHPLLSHLPPFFPSES